MIIAAKWIIIFFGLFIVFAGFIMLLKPEKARQILRKAGSTNFINYTELIVRMVPAVGLILYAEHSKFEAFFEILGWFMLVSSIVLIILPRKLHHQYSVRCAEIIKPNYFRIISPLSFIFGGFLIYALF